jgi:hypothetical protein
MTEAVVLPATVPAPTVARDHLFISYAIEDLQFVRWLALKLSMCGYRVWWDRTHLKGGDPFPTKIDEAIKTRSFRVLAVMSHVSSHKQNPERERTAALAISRARSENFLIPLNLELRPSELPWDLSNLNFIAFDKNWAAGLRELLDQLRSDGAPCFPSESVSLVRPHLEQPSFIVHEPERVWFNHFEITELPAAIRRYEWHADVPDEVLGQWVRHRESGRAFWAFETAPDVPGMRRPDQDQYATLPGGPRIQNDAATFLVRQYVERHGRARGLGYHVARLFYFPESSPFAARLPFRLPDGRASWVRPVGTRRVWQAKRPEDVRYHLGFGAHPELFRFGSPVLRVRPTVLFAGADGGLDGARSTRRAKAVRRGWFNDKWLARVCGIGAYLGDGAPAWRPSEGVALSISSVPAEASVPLHLDETARTAALRAIGGAAVDESDVEGDAEHTEDDEIYLDDDEGEDEHV